MHHVAVPFHLVRVGDVIAHPSLVSSDPFAVIKQVGEEKVGDGVNQVIRWVSVAGEQHRLEWRPRPDAPADTLSRVGQGCAPTSKGLRSFIAQQLRQAAGSLIIGLAPGSSLPNE